MSKASVRLDYTNKAEQIPLLRGTFKNYVCHDEKYRDKITKWESLIKKTEKDQKFGLIKKRKVLKDNVKELIQEGKVRIINITYRRIIIGLLLQFIYLSTLTDK